MSVASASTRARLGEPRSHAMRVQMVGRMVRKSLSASCGREAVMKERASVAGMEDPDVPSGGNTDVFALAEVDSDSPSDSDSSYE